MKKLVIDQISKRFDPKNEIALGPWCFKNKISIEDLLNKISKIYFEIKLIKSKLLNVAKAISKNIQRKLLYF